MLVDRTLASLLLGFAANVVSLKILLRLMQPKTQSTWTEATLGANDAEQNLSLHDEREAPESGRDGVSVNEIGKTIYEYVYPALVHAHSNFPYFHAHTQV